MPGGVSQWCRRPVVHRLSRNSDPQFPRPPRLVLALLAFELVAVLVLLYAGAPMSYVAIGVGPVTALTMAFLNPTVQELARPQAKLSVVAEEGNDDGVIYAPAPHPWPVDVDRVVANELAAARETLSAEGSLVDVVRSISSLSSLSRAKPIMFGPAMPLSMSWRTSRRACASG